jgi:beta-lactamase class A
VYDVTTGETYVYKPYVHERTASIVKIDILADLLRQSQVAHIPLTSTQRSIATSMIEESDNESADVLWNEIGGLKGIDSFNATIGFSQTIPHLPWGAIETTALDQLKLLKTITLPNGILTNMSRSYEMDLMENVNYEERFGIGTGTPSSAVIGLKDGWYPESDTGWQLNSTGFVKSGRRFYLLVEMCTDNPNETYGINTLTKISSFIWLYLDR